MGTVVQQEGGISGTVTSREIEIWYRQKTGCGLADNKKYMYIVGRDPKNRDIQSLIVYSDYTKYSITMDVYAPRLLTRGLIKSMLCYPFNELKVTKIFGFIDQRNVLSQRVFKKMGGREEGRIKDFFGEGIDRLIYTATKEDVKQWVT